MEWTGRCEASSLEMEEKAELLQWCLPGFGSPYLCSERARNSYAVEPADSMNHSHVQPNGDLQQIKPPTTEASAVEGLMLAFM
jgi:hypothetical protein